AVVMGAHQLDAAERADVGVAAAGIDQQEIGVFGTDYGGPAVIELGLERNRADAVDAGAGRCRELCRDGGADEKSTSSGHTETFHYTAVRGGASPAAARNVRKPPYRRLGPLKRARRLKVRPTNISSDRPVRRQEDC